MKQVIFLLLLLVSICSLRAQSLAGESADSKYRYLIDMPAAGVLEKGMVAVSTDLLPNGVVLGRIDVGVFNSLSFGISYGGENIIGSGRVSWYKTPGVNIRFNMFEESVTFPAITIGFDSQGKGIWFGESNRYEVKSPGFFGAVSKNYALLGYIGIHGAVSYSIENADNDNFVNFMVGAEKTIGKQVSLLMDYNFGLNDNDAKYGKGNGYLNLGLRWSIAPGFTLGFDLRDLLDNRKWSPSSADRAVHLQFIQKI